MFQRRSAVAAASVRDARHEPVCCCPCCAVRCEDEKSGFLSRYISIFQFHYFNFILQFQPLIINQKVRFLCFCNCKSSPTIDIWEAGGLEGHSSRFLPPVHFMPNLGCYRVLGPEPPLLYLYHFHRILITFSRPSFPVSAAK